MQHAVDLIEVTAAPLERRQQDAAQRVAERREAEAALKRFGDDGRATAGDRRLR